MSSGRWPRAHRGPRPPTRSLYLGEELGIVLGMATPPFAYQEPLPLSGDATDYRLLSKEGLSTVQFEGREVLKVEPEVLSFLTQAAFRDSAFMLRTSHLKQLAAILEDPEASANDRYVALTLLKNAEI